MARRTKRIKDEGYKNMVRNLIRNRFGSIEIGIFSDAVATRSHVDGSAANQLAYRYAIHDQGRGKNPKRETLMPAINKALSKDKFVKEFLSFGLDRTSREFEKRVNRAGLRLSARVKIEITKIKRPAKKASTLAAIARKYGTKRANPLVVTADMRNAVNFRYAR